MQCAVSGDAQGKRNWQAVPVNTAATYSVAAMLRFSFQFRFTWKSTARPMPAPVHNPATADPKDKDQAKYSSVNRTEAAQLGINPSNAASSG